MKSILIIGMGRFGQHLCRNMAELGSQIMVVDEIKETMEEMLPFVVSAKIGDCTRLEVLESLGIGNFDVVFVCIRTNFQSSLEITSMVKEMGARHVISKANRDIHAKFLLRNGADEVIYPDKDIALRTAVRFSSDKVFDYMELSDEFTVCEILPLEDWVGKTLRELDLRREYGVTVLGHKVNHKAKFAINADYRIKKEEHLLIVGEWESVGKVLKELG